MINLKSTLLEDDTSKMISLSCFSRPDSFQKKLIEMPNEFPSNNVKKKTIMQLIEQAKLKRKEAKSMASMM